MLNKKKRNISFLSEVPAENTTKSIEEPMLTKKEQRSMKTPKGKKSNNLYSSENVVAFTPEDNFLYFKSIKNHEIPVYVTGHEDPKEVRCMYCGKIHPSEKSVFIPEQMYDEGEGEKEVRVYQGSGFFDCFECAYRYILQQTSYGSHTTPYLYTNARYYFLNMFMRAYPNEELVPAPKFEHMDLKWNGKYTFIRMNGCEYRRNLSYYQMRKEEGKDGKIEKTEEK